MKKLTWPKYTVLEKTSAVLRNPLHPKMAIHERGILRGGSEEDRIRHRIWFAGHGMVEMAMMPSACTEGEISAREKEAVLDVVEKKGGSIQTSVQAGVDNDSKGSVGITALKRGLSFVLSLVESGATAILALGLGIGRNDTTPNRQPIPGAEPIRSHFKITEDLLTSLKPPSDLQEALAAIDAGADVNARDSDGLTPLMLVAKVYYDASEKIDAARLGFDLEVETNTSAVDAAIATAERTLFLVDSVIKSLLVHGADFNIKDNSGQDVFGQKRGANWPPALHELRPD